MPDLTGRDLDAAVCGIMEARPSGPCAPLASPLTFWSAALDGARIIWLPRPVSTDISWAMRAYAVLHERGLWELSLDHEFKVWVCSLIRGLFGFECV